jgi:nitrite reductase (NADH) small subunit/3-phenylpropionate/trans-cinnamate dioxygenase ferredoxin subunit
MPQYVKVMSTDELPPGQATERMVEGKAVALYNVGGRFFATPNFCLHRGGPLGQGQLDGSVIMCPWHAWTFDVTTGENTVNADLKIPCLAVKVEAGQIFVQVD